MLRRLVSLLVLSCDALRAAFSPLLRSAALLLLKRPDAPLGDVFAALAPEWRAAAERAAAARKELKKSPMLVHEGSAVTAAEAARLGVKVLCKDGTDKVVLGLFKLPAIPPDFAVGPKGGFLLR